MAARGSRRRPGGRLTRVALQIGLGLGALAVFFWRVDTGEVFRQIGAVDLRWVLLGLVAFTGSKVLHAWRWWQFLGRSEAPLVPLIGVFLTANMANSLLPLRAGDLLRVEVPNHRFGIPRSVLVSSVFVVESVLDLFAFAILLVVALLLADLPPVIQPLVSLIGISAVVLFVALVILARSESAISRWLGQVSTPLPSRLGRSVRTMLPQFIEGMASLRTNTEAARVVAISLSAWLVEVLVYFLLARAFGLHLDLWQALILMIAANLIVSLPITPWSIGPYELAVTEALVAIGESRSGAGAFALGSHLMLQAWIVLTGVAAMLALRLGPRDLWPGTHRPVPAPEADAPPEDVARSSGSPPPP